MIAGHRDPIMFHGLSGLQRNAVFVTDGTSVWGTPYGRFWLVQSKAEGAGFSARKAAPSAGEDLAVSMTGVIVS